MVNPPASLPALNVAELAMGVNRQVFAGKIAGECLNRSHVRHQQRCGCGFEPTRSAGPRRAPQPWGRRAGLSARSQWSLRLLRLLRMLRMERILILTAHHANRRTREAPHD